LLRSASFVQLTFLDQLSASQYPQPASILHLPLQAAMLYENLRYYPTHQECAAPKFPMMLRQADLDVLSECLLQFLHRTCSLPVRQAIRFDDLHTILSVRYLCSQAGSSTSSKFPKLFLNASPI